MEDLNIVEIKEPNQVLDLLKTEVSLVLSSMYEEAKDNLSIDREDYETEEEYQIMHRINELELIDEIKEVKHTIFSGLLDTYNTLVRESNLFRAKVASEKRESEEMIDLASFDMKKAGIITVGGSLLLPIIAPLLIIFNGSRIGLDILTKKYHSERIEFNEMLLKEIKEVQDPFYELIDTLRTDYHRSNEELKELEEKAINGEDISSALIEFINPERIGLERIDLKEIPLDDELKYIKRID